jgi:hypothetical protein
VEEAIAPYAGRLPMHLPPPPDPGLHLLEGPRELLAAFWLTLDAINFGSGWFPTLRKRQGRSGYFTIAGGIRERFVSSGPWSAEELTELRAGELAAWLGQDPEHELIDRNWRNRSDASNKPLGL